MIEPPETQESTSTCRSRSSSASRASTPMWNNEARKPPPDNAIPTFPIVAVRMAAAGTLKAPASIASASVRYFGVFRRSARILARSANCRSDVCLSDDSTLGAPFSIASRAFSNSPSPMCASAIVSRIQPSSVASTFGKFPNSSFRIASAFAKRSPARSSFSGICGDASSDARRSSR